MECFSNLSWSNLSWVWLGAGIVAGLASGLLGIGGGVLMVPVLLWTFSFIAIPSSVAMHIAIASSLGVIVFTALSGGLAHFRRGALLPKTVALMALGGTLGAIGGSWSAVHLSRAILQTLFAFLLVWFGIRFIQDRSIVPNLKPLPRNFLSTGFVGLISGFFSALFGVGGGSIAVALMVSLLGMPIHQAIGTSMGLILINALAGSLSYLSMVPPTVEIRGLYGYLYLPAVIWLALGSLPAAPFGATLAHRLHPDRLKKIFGLVLLLIGVLLLFLH